MKLILPLLLFIGYSSAATADFKCEDLTGMWSSERYDTTLSSDRRTIKALNPDGSYWIKFIHDNGVEITEQEEHGNWSCDGSVLSIEITKIDNEPVYFHNKFKLLKPSGSFHSLKPIAPNCGNVIGDCSTDILLEYFRVMS